MQKPISILDVGGKINFWENRGLAGNNDYIITIVNIEKEKSLYSNIKTKMGDATDLSPFNDKSFDVVHSNSVIEHLYNFENQKKMVSEIIRVGQKYIVQTPNKFFLIEPHYLLPFFQFIPNKLKYFILTKTKLSRLKKWDKKFQSIFSMNDKGEKEKKGSLLVTDYGKGKFIYTGLSFFRQLPEGIPGAYRLFINLISHKK